MIDYTCVLPPEPTPSVQCPRCGAPADPNDEMDWCLDCQEEHARREAAYALDSAEDDEWLGHDLGGEA